MKYLIAVLPALATLSAVSAQSVIGVHNIPASEAGVPNASSSTSVASGYAESQPSGTSTSVDMSSSVPTAAPSSSANNSYGYAVSSSADDSYGYTDAMPYSSMTQGGYQQMGCGYGYARQSGQGYCVQQPWVRHTTPIILL
jgi:hypothetical protein